MAPRVDLRSVHRLLIRAAIALSVVLVVYGVFMYARRDNAQAGALAVVGALGAILWFVYLRWFNRKTRGSSLGS